jgi:hypothetical protein
MQLADYRNKICHVCCRHSIMFKDYFHKLPCMLIQVAVHHGAPALTQQSWIVQQQSWLPPPNCHGATCDIPGVNRGVDNTAVRRPWQKTQLNTINLVLLLLLVDGCWLGVLCCAQYSIDAVAAV